MLSDVEVIAAACEALAMLGLSDFEIRLNNRKLLNAFVENAGIQKEKAGGVFRAMDKLEKIKEERVRAELREKVGLTDDEISNIMEFTKINGTNAQKLELVSKTVENNASGIEGVSELREIIDLFGRYNVSKRCRLVIDLSLVRGLDYYTGPIFEVKLPKTEIGSLSVAAGGRYDNLIQLYGAPPTPATGISLGVERILEVIKGQAPEDNRRLIYVAPVKSEFRNYAISVLQQLREAGFRAETDLMGRSLRKQLEYANAVGARFVAVVGEKEVKCGGVTIRDFLSGKEETGSLPDIIKKLSTPER
jgi:histidyl-tRNA synthetase